MPPRETAQLTLDDAAARIRDHGVARRHDPETSHDAARQVRDIRRSQADVLRVLRLYGPMTDPALLQYLEIATGHRWTPSGARTRRSELVEVGLVEDSGRRIVLPTGRRAIVWQAAGS